jgi:methyl-CpG-binding domain protein 4
MKLLQEKYKSHPWKMMVCCILLNQTNNKQVSGVIEELFEKYKSSAEMQIADKKELSELLKPLGLYNKRAETLRKFSKDFDENVGTKGTKISDCYGIGQYGQDSWDIFIENKLDIKPTDKKLKAYLNRL